MKIFSWMHSKLTGKPEIKKEISAPSKNHIREDSQREEFRDWPNGLFAIGTLGNDYNIKKIEHKSHTRETQSIFQDHIQDLTPEEINQLQKEITQLSDNSGNILEAEYDESEYCNAFCGDSDDRIGKFERSTNVVCNREKDICVDNTKRSIGKKSFSFILKKMFVCRSGFAPTPSLRDPIPEMSRMEKILRAILHKKIYPQGSTPKATAKKYLETSNHLYNSDSDDEYVDMEYDGSKWVKTDSDYIVLEI